MRTGTARLPLHGGKAPRWLFSRMKRLAREIVLHVVEEHGQEELLRRLSDPFWFQALGCSLGFDWHSSGVTTTTCGAIKEGIKGVEHELGFFAAGGKGGVSRRTPQEIRRACDRLARDPEGLVLASRLSAKVDSAAVQDGYQLYHHCFFFTASGKWCVVQQGMSDASRMARRYHWFSGSLQTFTTEPHAAVCCNATGLTLNLVAAESRAAREVSTEIAVQNPEKTLAQLERAALILPRRHGISPRDINPRYLKKILLKTYVRAPGDFEEVLQIEGVGPQTLRALALVSELIYGTPASTRDPARFSFAHGGKDGVPYPVDRETYDRTIYILHRSLERAQVDRSEKVSALRRLAVFETGGDSLPAEQ